MVEPLRHRQTKGAETDMLSLTSPRHTSTLPTPAVSFAQIAAIRSELKHTATTPVGRIDAACYRPYAGEGPSAAMVLSIGADGTRKRPENGWLSSRIKKIALATANEPKASAPMLVGLRPEVTPKPKNRSIAQDTTMTISGQEIGLANCNDMRSRVCWKAAELAPIDEMSTVCAGERGLSEDKIWFHFSNLDM